MFYKVIHKPTGLFWKGGGMQSNNKSMGSIYNRSSKYHGEKLDKNSKEHALEVCFSKTGKVWSKKNHVSTAIGYGHEKGLNDLLKNDCEIIEYPEKQLTTEDIRNIFYSGIEASRLYYGEAIAIDFEKVFDDALIGKYLKPSE